MSELLIEAASLRNVLSDPGWVVFDVRYSLSDPGTGKQTYLKGYIPGAYFLDQGSQLAGPCTGTNGRHPLPEYAEFRQLLQGYGLTQDSKIVVYDDSSSFFAARAWWLLRWQGYTDVRILNGGIKAWQEAGGTLQESISELPAQVRAETAESAAHTMPIVSATDILSFSFEDGMALVDARTPERYRGDSEPLDPVAGRIEGALNRPVANNLQPDGRFKPAAQLHDEFRELLGPRPADNVIHYCGSGITACHNLFAMELAGLKGSALYPGSWSEWCSDSSRPVARG